MKNRLRNFKFLFLIFLITNVSLLQAQPAINSFSPLIGSVGSLITIKGSKLNNPTYVTIGNVNAIIISSENTQVVAMVMPGAVTGSVSVVTASGIAISSDNFTVHVSALPIKQLGDKLVGTSTSNSSQQGSAVAVSADGNTAVVGAGYDTGGVFVYTRNNNVWAQQGEKLIGTGAATVTPAVQGFSVAISADGNTLIEGGVGDNGFTGAAWVFTRDKNGLWSQQGNKLVGSNSIIVGSATPEQGYSVSISADGNTAIIGGRRDSNYVGAAWVFTRINNTWTEQQKLIGKGYVNIINVQGTLQHYPVEMGNSVAISADGNNVLIGGPNDNKNIGAAWVFKRSGNAWIQQGDKLVGSGGNRSFLGGIQQGTSVAVNADGNTAIIGAPFDLDSAGTDNTANYYNGAIWIFTRNGNTWSQQGNKLFATDASLGAEQGWSVSISADGNTAIVGAPTDSSYVGGSWIYTRNSNGWIQSSHKLLGTGYLASPKQGWSVGISADGNTAIVGGPENNLLGAAWVFADTNSNVLAVSFANFKAYTSGKYVQTTWIGFNETDLNSYDVERSANGYNFNKLVTIPASINSSLQNNYKWLDVAPFEGDNFYRIKAISKDGSAQYSSIIKVNINNTQNNVQVYPNPVINKTIQLHLNNIIAGNYTISIYNTNGETLYRQNFQHIGGSASVAINLKNAAAGVYHVELKNSINNYQTTVTLQ